VSITDPNNPNYVEDCFPVYNPDDDPNPLCEGVPPGQCGSTNPCDGCSPTSDCQVDIDPLSPTYNQTSCVEW
jgi:hypothetical protein